MVRKKLTEVQQAFLKTGAIGAIPDGEKRGGTEVALSQLVSWQGQPRTFFKQEHVDRLAASFQERGLDHPLLVRAKGGQYEVIAGECRLRAAHQAGLTAVPVKIVEMDDEAALVAALDENLEREDLNPIEVLSSLLSLLKRRLGLDEEETCNFLYTMKRHWESLSREERENREIDLPDPNDPRQREVWTTFERHGFNWYTYTCNQLKLRNLPSYLYEQMAAGNLDYSKGLKLKAVKDDLKLKELVGLAIEQNWSLRQITEEVKKVNERREPAGATPPARLDRVTRRLKKVKLWKADPKLWKKIEQRLETIEKWLDELEGQAVRDGLKREENSE